MKTLQNTDDLLLFGMLKCRPVALYCQKSPRKGIASPCRHSVQEPPCSVHVKAEHIAPLLYYAPALPEKWEDSPTPAATGIWAGQQLRQHLPAGIYPPWAKLSHYSTAESSVSELGFVFNWWAVPVNLTRPPALLKQETTIPAFPKRDWETCSRPYDELWELRQTCQRCPHPLSTAGLSAAATDLFKQSKNYSKWCILNKSNTFSKHSACTLTGPAWQLMSSLQNLRSKKESQLPSAFSSASCCCKTCTPPAQSPGPWGLLWCLPLLLHIQRLLGYPGCDQCPEKQGKGDTEAHPAVLRGLPTASQLPIALEAQRGCSSPEDSI